MITVQRYAIPGPYTFTANQAKTFTLQIPTNARFMYVGQEENVFYIYARIDDTQPLRTATFTLISPGMALSSTHMYRYIGSLTSTFVILTGMSYHVFMDATITQWNTPVALMRPVTN